MRSDAWDQTYVEFVAARQPELHRLAVATHADHAQADEALRRGLTDLYLAWPRVRREGTEETEARRLVTGTTIGRDDAELLVDDREPPPRAVEAYVAAGRSARRRRRHRVAIVTLTGMLTAFGVTLAALSTAGGGGHGPDPVPPRPTVLPTPVPVNLLVPPHRFVRPDSPPLFYLYGRMFKRSEDVTVLATFGTPEPATHPRGGGIVRVDGTTIWVVAVGSEPRALSEQRAGPYDPDAFQTWQATEQQVLSGRLALASAPGGYRPPVSDDDSPATFSGGLLVAKPGGVVTQRVLHPVVSESAVQPCHDQAVRVHTAAQDWFVLGYNCADGGALYSEPVGVRADTLASWLPQVRRAQDRFLR
jgi:hypothetical protein